MNDALAFSAEWLALREPADLAARSEALNHALSHALGRRPGSRVRVLDLATGTGANLRALARHLPPGQDWTVADLDRKLLDEVPVCTARWATRQGWIPVVQADRVAVTGPGIDLNVETAQLDLEDLNERGAGPDATSRLEGLFEGRHLVTASALLDLLSESQALMLARFCRRAGAIALFALTYDGRITFAPAEPEDEIVREGVNAHQRTDKGFGLALGPDASARVERAFSRLGYAVRVEPSDWSLGPESADLQRPLLEGWASAARAMAPEQSAALDGWLARRLAHVDAGRSRLDVGHSDLLAALDVIE